MVLVQTDEKSLAGFGDEASQMLLQLDYSGLASRFGYALSYGREPHVAIEEDYLRAVSSPIQTDEHRRVVVKYFKPNSIGIYAVVECLVPVAARGAVLLELVVTGQSEKHITLEDISGVAE